MALAKSESHKPIRAFFIENATDGLFLLPLYTGLSEPGTSRDPYVSTHVPSLDRIEVSHVHLVIHQVVPYFPVLTEVRLFGWMPGMSACLLI